MGTPEPGYQLFTLSTMDERPPTFQFIFREESWRNLVRNAPHFFSDSAVDTIASDDNVAGERISILCLDRDSGTRGGYVDHALLQEDLILVFQVFVQDLK
jgi:hypothetical protein